MPRSRGSSEGPKGNSPRLPIHLKTTVCSEANGITRHSVDRSSPKLSPRSPLHEKKRGTRVSELESKLNQTKEEVKKLKEKLALSEAAKKSALQELEETKKQLIVLPVSPKLEISETNNDDDPHDDDDDDDDRGDDDDGTTSIAQEESITSPATDVFEVRVPSEMTQIDEADTKTMIEAAPSSSKEEDALEVNAKLVKIEKEINLLAEENEGLKKRVEEASEGSRKKEEELKMQMVKMEEELCEGRKKTERLEQKVEEVEGAKEVMEVEMRKLRVQTEQWRKAAEAAAAVLSGGDYGRIGERCGSMGYVGSPGIGEVEEKRRSIKMFGELWKKKSHK